jgi:hypothetical protein
MHAPLVGGPARPARGSSRAVLLVLALLLGVVPSLGTLGAPWIAEDAALLEQASHDSPLADWTRPQGGLTIVRFWRPVVSLTWGLQERATGIDPLPLRALNLGAHLACVALVWAVTRRLGMGVGAAFLASAWVATFPDQGGTVTWLAGRTDGLSGATLLLGLWLGLGPRPSLALPAALLAAATKEFGFLLPAWIALLAWGRGESRPLLLRRVFLAAVGAAVALGIRRVALGAWVGGYPSTSLDPAAPLLALEALARAAPLSGLGFGLVLLWALWRSRSDAHGRRLAGAALGAMALALVLLGPLLGDGWLEPQNARLLFVPELALALAVAALGGGLRGAEGLVVAALVLVPRSAAAWRDTHEWAEAARVGEQRVAAARAIVAEVPAAPEPVLMSDLPRVHAGAYCLGFGLASRFRAPFPATPRPIWPLRPLLFDERVRPPTVALRVDGSLWPEELGRVASMTVAGPDGVRLERVVLDATVFAAARDDSPRFTLGGGPPGAPLEALLFTDGGYEAFALGALDAQGGATGSWQAVMAVGNGHTSVGEALLFSADLGARRAGIELRALDEQGTPVATGGWIELVWDEALVRRALSAR